MWTCEIHKYLLSLCLCIVSKKQEAIVAIVKVKPNPNQTLKKKSLLKRFFFKSNQIYFFKLKKNPDWFSLEK